jgi:hypothetical protein
VNRGAAALGFAAIALALTGSPARAQEPPAEDGGELPRSLGTGVVLAVGVGDEFGGQGVGVIYDHALGTRLPFQIAPRGALGVHSDVATLAVGVSGGFGYSHRAIVDVGVGMVDRETLYLHGYKLDERWVYAVTLAAGYEWVSEQGFVLRALVGGGRKLGNVTQSGRFVAVGTLACGFKFR